MIVLNENEYAPYQKVYLDTLRDGTTIEEDLNETFANAMEVLNNIPNEKEEFAYAEGKWTIKELLQHIIDCERIFVFRALCFARKDTVAIAGFDENGYADASNANKRTYTELLEEFRTTRASSILFFRSMSSETLLEKGIASGISISVRAIGYVAAGHVQHHINIIKERYL